MLRTRPKGIPTPGYRLAKVHEIVLVSLPNSPGPSSFLFTVSEISFSQFSAMRFALIEAKAAIAHLAYNFKVEPCEKTPKKIILSKATTIRKPANGMWLKFTARENRNNGFVKL